MSESANPTPVTVLTGYLGAGKTTLARGLIRHMTGPETEAPSPTFTLVQTYETPAFPIWHFDLYRLEHPGEARELGMEEAVDGLALIEWPERLGRDLPAEERYARHPGDGDRRVVGLNALDARRVGVDGGDHLIERGTGHQHLRSRRLPGGKRAAHGACAGGAGRAEH